LQMIDRSCSKRSDAWLIGSLYRGSGILGNNIRRHLNGMPFTPWGTRISGTFWTPRTCSGLRTRSGIPIPIWRSTALGRLSSRIPRRKSPTTSYGRSHSTSIRSSSAATRS
jgi:hypothetical protein